LLQRYYMQELQSNSSFIYGSFIVATELPDEEWLYGYILSFGGDAEVIEPKIIRDGIKNRLEECLKKYS